MYIYVIMKTMCPPGYHHNGFVATHALGHMMIGKRLVLSSLQCAFVCFTGLLLSILNKQLTYSFQLSAVLDCSLD